MNLSLVVSGGQTGVDQAAWRAANRSGFASGGAMPRGFLTEDGPRPEFAEQFRAEALSSADVVERTRENVARSDATLVLVEHGADHGTRTTVSVCRALGKPHRLVTIPAEREEPATVCDIVAWLAQERVGVLNVAGPRESSEPGIGARAEAFLDLLFRALRDG